MDLFEELQNLMIKYHFRPSKKLSQFYCINEALLRFLANSAKLKETDIVLEVGPGTGFLTKILLEKCKVVAVEKDEIMIELLKDKFEKEIKEGKLELVHGDILLQDFDKLKVNKIVSLPPYHLSSDLTIKIILSSIEKAVIVFDTGYVEKLTAFEGMKEYNASTVLANLNAKIEVLETIDKMSFFPKPNCQSVVIKMDFDRKETSKEFYVFLKELFRHKNKNLSRGLKQSYPALEKEKIITKTNFDELKYATEKVYALPVEKLLEIYKEVK